jgi:hypothetical protein
LAGPITAIPDSITRVLEEFQVLGYPILSMRSIPVIRAGCRRYFKEDMDAGRIDSPLEVTDVWPENYSANSVQKVWAAKFAARHPNVVVLDLSSFKCGHDAPTYGLMDSIIGAARPRTRRCTTSTPTSRRLDQDSRSDLRPQPQAARRAARRCRQAERRAAPQD